MSVQIREKKFKLGWRWYLTPTKLNKINASYLNVGNVRTSVHTFICGGNAKKYKDFGNYVIFKELNDICEKDTEFNPEIAPLLIFENVEYDD